MKPSLLFENDSYVILNKPAGWLSVPGRPSPDGEQTREVITTWIYDTFGFEPWVIHRLDRFTSGVILFAKNPIAHREGNEWFLKREVKKIYHFFAAPVPTRPAIQVRTPIQDKPAQTLFEILEKGPRAFYGKATPLTGRFHQIREHAREGGFPILGDKSCGGLLKFDAIAIPRICLHAHELTLPFGVFQAPLPADMVELRPEILK